MGHKNEALDLLSQHNKDSKSFEPNLIKATLLVQQSKSVEAIAVLDQTLQETPYQKYYVFQVLARAFLLNNEPKSAQVCVNESSNNWDEAQKSMTPTEILDCQSQAKLTETRVQMERQNTPFIGDINSFAFLKGDEKATAAAATQKAEAPTQPVQAVSAVKPHINAKYDWYQNA